MLLVQVLLHSSHICRGDSTTMHAFDSFGSSVGVILHDKMVVPDAVRHERWLQKPKEGRFKGRSKGRSQELHCNGCQRLDYDTMMRPDRLPVVEDISCKDAEYDEPEKGDRGSR